VVATLGVDSAPAFPFIGASPAFPDFIHDDNDDGIRLLFDTNDPPIIPSDDDITSYLGLDLGKIERDSTVAFQTVDDDLGFFYDEGFVEVPPLQGSDIRDGLSYDIVEFVMEMDFNLDALPGNVMEINAELLRDATTSLTSPEALHTSVMTVAEMDWEIDLPNTIVCIESSLTPVLLYPELPSCALMRSLSESTLALLANGLLTPYLAPTTALPVLSPCLLRKTDPIRKKLLKKHGNMINLDIKINTFREYLRAQGPLLDVHEKAILKTDRRRLFNRFYQSEKRKRLQQKSTV